MVVYLIHSMAVETDPNSCALRSESLLQHLRFEISRSNLSVPIILLRCTISKHLFVEEDNARSVLRHKSVVPIEKPMRNGICWSFKKFCARSRWKALSTTSTNSTAPSAAGCTTTEDDRHWRTYRSLEPMPSQIMCLRHWHPYASSPPARRAATHP